jgi:homoserine kinase
VIPRALVRVPASSANLGPGFDCLAIALALHLELEVLETGAFAVETDLPVPSDESNLCVRAFARLAPAEGLRFRISSQIPLAGGLGSSAAAVVAGMLAAVELRRERADLLAEATALEGHPDNVAAALYGGFVVCTGGRAFRGEVPPDLVAILVVPEEPVETSAARAMLPGTVALADAVFNVAHASLVTLGLARGDREMLAEGLKDRLHEQARSPLFPRSYELARRASALGAIGASISGAGPSVLVWSDRDGSGPLADRIRGEVADWASVLTVPFEARGAHAVQGRPGSA